jgi:uncharacterized PurR-regulated membrane protein YhhQ (DUF165 family)
MSDRTRWHKAEGLIYLALFAACIPLANWLIGNVGVVCVPDGPCVVPVWPGISAPSGVLAIGAALVLRDLVQRRLGLKWAFAAIVGGTALSGFVAPPALVIASAAAFAFSETADLLVFTPLQKRGLVLAVLASSAVGLAVDSVLFLSLAFGSLEYLEGQMLGKAWGILVALPLVFLFRMRDKNVHLAAI